MSREHVQAGLRRLIETEPRWAEWTPDHLRNRLLDEVGSDNKPLALLLMTVLDRGVPQRFPPAVIDAPRWEALRAVLGARLVDELFMQPEMAAWAVESWALALHVIEERLLTPAPVPAPSLRLVRDTRPVVGAPRQAVAASGTRLGPPTHLGPGAVSRAPRTTSSSGGMANRGAVGVRPPEIPRWAFKALGGFIVVMLLLMLATMTATLRNDAHASSALASAAAPNSRSVGPPERDTAGARAAVEVQPVGLTTPNGAPTSTNAPLAASPLAVSRGGLPFTAADSAKLQVVTPPRRATFGAEQQASADRAPTPVGGALDEVLLTDGRKLRGRVELIRAGTVQFHEVTSGLRYEFSKKEIVQVTTEFGNVVKFDGSEAATPNVGVLLRRGVGGSYRVRYAVNKVSGTSECGTLWKDGMPPDDRVVVRHVPGADTLQFGFVRGATFNAVIDVGARFSSTFVILPDQALTASALTSRISGAFSDSGFTGQVNLIGYRRSRPGSGLTDTACHSILDMSATLERPDH